MRPLQRTSQGGRLCTRSHRRGCTSLPCSARTRRSPWRRCGRCRRRTSNKSRRGTVQRCRCLALEGPSLRHRLRLQNEKTHQDLIACPQQDPSTLPERSTSPRPEAAKQRQRQAQRQRPSSRRRAAQSTWPFVQGGGEEVRRPLWEERSHTFDSAFDPSRKRPLRDVWGNISGK
jgi:hypothetical protein